MNPVLDLARVVWRYGPDARYLPLTALYFLKLAAFEPWRLAERAWFAARGERPGLPHPPLFVLGYYRSGTTHLQELLAQDRRFATMNFYQCFFPTAFTSTESWVKPVFERIIRATGMEHPAHRVPFTFSLLAEDDVAMVATGSALAANWAQVFPRSFREISERTWFMEGLTAAEEAEFGDQLEDLLWRVSRANGHRPLLLKSPPHTGRMAFLARRFPGAKFVFIRRNPYEVYKSNLGLWKSFEKTSLQALTPEVVRDAILWSFDRTHAAYERDKVAIAPGHLCEVAFEEFVADPMATVGRVYDTLDLGGFDAAAPAMASWLDDHHDKPRAPYAWDADEIAAIEAAWGEWLDRWGYARDLPRARAAGSRP